MGRTVAGHSPRTPPLSRISEIPTAKPAPTPGVNVETLDANRTVQAVLSHLTHQRKHSAGDLAQLVGTGLANLMPVLKAMQQAGMIEAGRFFPGSRNNYYRLKGQQ